MTHAIDEDPMNPLQNDPLILGKAWWDPLWDPSKPHLQRNQKITVSGSSRVGLHSELRFKNFFKIASEDLPRTSLSTREVAGDIATQIASDLRRRVHGNERKRAQTQVCKRAQKGRKKGAKERKRALPRQN